MKYLLPCSCGQNIAIEVSQAGQSVACSCGKQVDVPALRMIRQLKPAVEDSARARRSGNWSTLQGMVFALGLATAVAGLSMGIFYQWGRSKLDTKEVAWDHQLGTDMKLLEEMDLEDAWENWKLVRNSGIGPWAPPNYIRSRLFSKHLKTYVKIGLGIGVFGVGLMGIAFVLPRQSAGPPHKPRRTKK
jgi:hypothetical protein